MNRWRVVVWGVVGLLVIGLAACGGAGGDEPGATDGTTAAGTAAENDNETLEEAAQETTGEDPDQGEEATEGDETTEGEAEGSKDETLEELGGGFVYRREGGIAGFCDVVTVLAGTATIGSCATEPPSILGEVTLTADQSQQVLTWLEELRTFEHENADAATADAMSISIVFNGEGDNEPTDEVIAAIEKLAQELLAGGAATEK
ncbi:exported protein of unknown function [Candidatus Promineifilum breve]|uniref:Uncharacterized protein n=1 Tax=Candidatus Promineifilum breve TaxID=1806508 RepID=A0A160T742_9CHLR|nr:hypothetical protein [Candidatus Promineifilum breve]CUS05772.1 exported protein of unknown function [Candidatus Promineifilum breve]